MAETSNMQQAKVLRIGIVQGGKIVQERLIKPGQSVTIGESPKNTFVLPADGLPEGLPKRFTLFQARGDSYVLGFTEGMKGKVAVEGGIVGLDDLKGRPDTTQKGDVSFAPIAERNRGKIVVGGVTVLFQFVAAPPEPARKVVRADFRPKLIDEDDPVFLGFLALWTSLAAVLMVYVFTTGPIETVELEEIPDRFANVLLAPPEADTPPPELPDQEPNVEETTAQKEEKVKEKAAEKEMPKARNEKERQENAAKRREDAREAVAQKSAILALLGTRGENNNGSTVADVFGDGDGGLGDLDQVLDEAGSVETAGTAQPGVKGGSGNGGREDASVGGPSNSGGGQKAKVKKVETKAPSGKAGIGSVEAYSGEGADAVRKALGKYRGQIKACYDQRLKENPSLAGRVVLEIDVAAGRVSSARIDQNTTGDSALGSCLTRRARSWRLPAEVSDTLLLPFTFEAS